MGHSDTGLLRQSWFQWLFGDWDGLTRLGPDSLLQHPDRIELVLLAGAGHQQSGDVEAVSRCVRAAGEWGADREQVSRMLIAGAHNTLGRAAALAGALERARKHFEAGMRTLEPGGNICRLAQVRMQEQLEELGFGCIHSCIGFSSSPTQQSGKRTELLTLARMLGEQACFAEAESVLQKASRQDPDNPEILEALAENAMKRRAYVEAARRWQDVAEVLGPDTPQHIYTRLSDAYELVIGHGWGGTKEENHCWGDRSKHEILGELHQKLQPELYLEIGVDRGVSLALASCRAIGVDPRPRLDLEEPLKENMEILTLGSDAFFRDKAQQYLKTPPDLVFIDGMHLFEFALRDFMNVERLSKPSTLVVIDDVNPCHPTQALRRRKSGAWTGDIWKLHAILREYRPDLHMVHVNAHTTGLLLIWGLDAESRVLQDRYWMLVERYKHEERVPDTVLKRKGVLPSDEGVKKVVLALGKAGTAS